MDVFYATTADGIELALHRFAARGRRRAVCLCTHAMMANSRYLTLGPENGFAGYLAQNGVDTFLLDFRGHGLSRPPLSRVHSHWCFDHYVEYDLPAAVAAVCDAAGIEASQLVYSGHSLGGLVGLAAVGTGAIRPPRAIALWATSVWLTGARGSRRRRLAMKLYDLASRPLGRAPIRALRFGSNDEPRGYVAQLAEWSRTGRWLSRDGVDYLASLNNIRTRSWGACGTGDRLCQPSDARVLLSRLTGSERLRQVGIRCGYALDADHFGLVTRRELLPLWREFFEFFAS
ncbi:MAG: alpha/beta fold hydrolase [Proteobacteria bacterium]|nr:alpha/beta fold hydrolase [Pseudomonadota bacterium]